MSLVHENKKPHPCSICDKSFSTKTKWKNHITVVHERKKLFQCSICDYKSGLKQNMKPHFNARHGGLDIEIIYLGDKNHKCYNCDFKTYYKELLYKHIREIHDGKNSVKSFNGRRKEVIMESVRKVCKEGTKTSNVPVQDISKKSVESESVHERKKEEIRKSLRTVRKEGTKTSIVPVQDFSNESNNSTKSEKSHQCLICEKSFSKKYHLKEHVSSVHEQLKPHSCSICGKSFSVEKDLKRHILVVHEKQKLFQCSICDYKTGLRGNMKIHIDGVHEGLDVETIYLGDKDLKCKNCDFKTGLHGNLWKHIREVHDGKQNWDCEICKVSFEKESIFKSHQKTRHHKIKRLNRNASVQLESKKNLEKSDHKTNASTNDVSKTDSENPHLCLSCEKSFSKQKQLEDHIRLVHEQLKPYSCLICGKCFLLENRLKEHVLVVHEKLKLFQCSICDYKTGLKGNMKLHIDKVHDMLDVDIIYLGDKNEKCYTCGYKTGLKEDLNKHIQEVHDGKYSCPICSKCFSRANRLKDHVTVVHEKQKLYQCSICNFKTGLRQNMKSHINGSHKGLDVEMIYLGDKNHKCYNCDFSTGLKEELKNHIHEVHYGKENASESERLNKSPSSDFLNESAHEWKKEKITQNLDLRTVRKEGKKSPVQNFSNELVHERNEKGENASNASVEDLSIEEFIENYDPLEVNHLAYNHKESSKPKTKNGPIVPFLFGGINHVKPIQLSKIGSSVHEERKPYNCSFCDVSFLSKEHVKEHISIVHEGR